MKNKILFSALLMSSLSLTAFNTSTVIAAEEDVVVKDAKKMCSKGQNIFKITVRAFDGVACEISPIAIWAESNCYGVDEYENSQCQKKATATLDRLSKDQIENLETYGYASPAAIQKESDIEYQVRKAIIYKAMTNEDRLRWEEIKDNFPKSDKQIKATIN